MNKSELIAHIATETGMTKQSCAEAVDAVLNGIKTGLVNDGAVTIVGFGTFSVGERAARVGRNPRTGEEVEIAAARVPKFKAGSDLKAAVA
ncbi:integration host factor [Ralstonia solanacearum K60]|uniref:Integration host factor n=1 Tax=Ralstonia solanacearum K60 TaxID=1091042 RepID=A0AAP7ZKK8_RALSL|nr:HU family DNA-binding protein [Ralstonia solanacearum]OYQ12315.1 integration host factor [Ralstonia solanacearum K60]CCF96512.1 DNA-binding protein HU-beta, transcriptional regulator, beta subunit [Ralstonia solanacearum K60]